jgi:hypothetical protein
LSCLVLSCLALSCLVLSHLVLSCLVLSCLVLGTFCTNTNGYAPVGVRVLVRVGARVRIRMRVYAWVRIRIGTFFVNVEERVHMLDRLFRDAESRKPV